MHKVQGDPKNLNRYQREHLSQLMRFTILIIGIHLALNKKDGLHNNTEHRISNHHRDRQVYQGSSLRRPKWKIGKVRLVRLVSRVT